MEEELNKEQVRKDLSTWATKLKQADRLIREVYMDIYEVYGETK